MPIFMALMIGLNEWPVPLFLSTLGHETATTNLNYEFLPGLPLFVEWKGRNTPPGGGSFDGSGRT